jgi:hypothetical protein
VKKYLLPVLFPLCLLALAQGAFAQTNWEADSLRSDVDDVGWEISKLRRNAADYDQDEYARKLKRLEGDLEDLSSRAQNIGADEASSALEDASWDIKKVRSGVESDPRYFYGEREESINDRLRNVEWATEDAATDIND